MVRFRSFAPGLGLWLGFVAGGFSAPAAPPDSQSEFWPEIDAFIGLNSTTRLFVRTSFKNHPTGDSWQGNFGLHFDFALKPVFRRQLRERDDVFERKYLSFRAGYQYLTSFTDHSSPSSERRWIVECTSRFLLPGKLLLLDRNRGDLRFVSGQPFSTRYRNRLQLESDLKLDRVVVTPFVNAELFYDTRYDAWTRKRYSAGIEIPAGDHLVMRAYALRQNGSRSSIPHVNAFGLKFRFYF